MDHFQHFRYIKPGVRINNGGFKFLKPKTRLQTHLRYVIAKACIKRNNNITKLSSKRPFCVLNAWAGYIVNFYKPRPVCAADFAQRWLYL